LGTQELTDWQIGLIYEAAMQFPEEWMRKNFFEQKKSVANLDDRDMLDMGYSREDIARIKGYEK